MTGIILKPGAVGVHIHIDEDALLAKVQRAGKMICTSADHNKVLRRLAARGLIDLDAPADLYAVHTAYAKSPRQPDEGTGG